MVLYSFIQLFREAGKYIHSDEDTSDLYNKESQLRASAHRRIVVTSIVFTLVAGTFSAIGLKLIQKPKNPD